MEFGNYEPFNTEISRKIDSLPFSDQRTLRRMQLMSLDFLNYAVAMSGIAVGEAIHADPVKTVLGTAALLTIINAGKWHASTHLLSRRW